MRFEASGRGFESLRAHAVCGLPPPQGGSEEAAKGSGMRLLHRTYDAAEIKAHGFRPPPASPTNPSAEIRIWFTNRSLGPQQEETGHTWLEWDVSEEELAQLKPHLQGERFKGYREWLIPIDVANQLGPPRRCASRR
jgi:hypothetical protein